MLLSNRKRNRSGTVPLLCATNNKSFYITSHNSSLILFILTVLPSRILTVIFYIFNISLAISAQYCRPFLTMVYSVINELACNHVQWNIRIKYPCVLAPPRQQELASHIDVETLLNVSDSGRGIEAWALNVANESL